MRELHQAGDADSDRPVASRPTTPELNDEEVSVLCDIERAGSTKSRKQPVVQSVIERGFIVPSEEPLARVKLTALAQQRLSKRGVGLNKSLVGKTRFQTFLDAMPMAQEKMIAVRSPVLHGR